MFAIRRTKARLLALTALSTSLAFAAPALGQTAGTLTVDGDGAVVDVTADLTGDPGVLIRGDDATVNLIGVDVFGQGPGGVMINSDGVTLNIDADSVVQAPAFGVATFFFNPEAGPETFFETYADNLTVNNAGSILGQFNDGVILLGTSTLNNTGSIIGGRDLPEPTSALYEFGSLGDGVSGFLADYFTAIDQVPGAGAPFALNNGATGEIVGRRSGVIFSGGSVIQNDGAIFGDIDGIVQQQATYFIDAPDGSFLFLPRQIGHLYNTGSIGGRFQNGVSIQTVAAEGANFAVDLTATPSDQLRSLFAFDDVTAFDGLAINSGLIESFANAGDTVEQVVIDPVTGQQIPITTTAEFAALRMASANGLIWNQSSGVIRATNGAAGLDVNGIDFVGEQSGVIYVVNEGAITGDVLGADGQELILNDGLIDGGVGLGDGDDLFILGADGVVTGSVILGGGNDVFVWDTQGVVGVAADGGEGDDLLSLILGGDNYDGDLVFGFERLETSGSGSLDDIDLSLISEINLDAGGRLDIGSTGFAGSLFVNPGGEIVGVGEVEAIVVRGGIVAPGNSIGTITVTGDVSFDAATLYSVEVSSVGSDQILADGAVTLDGGQVSISGEDGVDLAPETALSSYTILSGAAGLTGTFASIADTLVFYDARLSYTPTAALVVLDPVGADFLAVAETNAQFGVGAVLQANLLNADGDFLQAMKDSFPGLDAAGVRQGLNTLSGSSHAWTPVAISDVGRTAANLAASGPKVGAGETQVWSGATVAPAQLDSAFEPVEVDSTVISYAAGVTRGLSDAVALGAFVGWGGADADDTVGGSVKTDGWFAGAQANLAAAGFELGAQAGYLDQDVDSDRRLLIGGVNRIASSDYAIDGWFGALDASYAFDLGSGWAIGPAAEIFLTSIESDAFAETGAGSLNLSGAGTDFDRTSYRVLGQAVRGDGAVQPTFQLGYQMDTGSRAVTIAPNFDGLPGQAFLLTGPGVSANAVVVGAGAQLLLAPNLTASVDYDAAFADQYDVFSASARLGYKF